MKDSIKEMIFGAELDSNKLAKINKLLLPIFGSKKAQDIIDQIKYSENYQQAIEKISQIMIDMLTPLETDVDFFANSPQVILLCGVNGSGKTTVAGKLSYFFQEQMNKKIVLAACDIFRAAAVDQLSVFAKRTNSIFVSKEKGNSASVAYEAIDVGMQESADGIILDTSGRLQNNKNLMNELKKTYEVACKKAECMNILVLDALLGYNTLDQVKVFNECLPLNGLIINKIDNIKLISGVILQLAQDFPNLSIFFVGTGEKICDLKKFHAQEFVNTCFSL